MTSSESTSCSEISFWKPSDGFWGTLVVDITSPGAALAEIEAAINAGISEVTHRYSFATYELMQKLLAPNRMAILRVMMGSGPLSIREVARRVGRDFKGVHTDVTALVRSGVLYKAENGQIVFPFDRIHFDFEMAGAVQSAA